MPFPTFRPTLQPVNLTLHRCPVSRENASHRILIAKYNALGDVLMATPMVAALRHAFPDAHISWIVKDAHREAIDANPHIDEIISGDGDYWRGLLPRRWKKWLDLPGRWLGLRWLKEAVALMYELRRRKYDLFIALSADEWPMLSLVVGAPVSIGITEGEHNPDARFYTKWFTGKDLPAHRTEKYFVALDALNLPRPASKKMIVGYTAEDGASISDLLDKNDVLQSERLIVIAPQTTWVNKNWTPRQYAVVADEIAQEQNCRVLFVGTRKDRDSIEIIRGEMKKPSVSTAGMLSVRQLSALIDRSSLVISGDTGPMHIAGALGTPFVALFGATTPAFYAPLSKPGLVLTHPVPCGPCEKMSCTNPPETYIACMRLISTHEVSDAAKQLLAE